MVCPCFITDYAGFCSCSDILYVPSIDELEHFCFTRTFGSCKLFKDGAAKAEAAKCGYSKAEIDYFLNTGRYKEGSKAPANRG
jgi:hypothetical protein